MGMGIAVARQRAAGPQELERLGRTFHGLLPKATDLMRGRLGHATDATVVIPLFQLVPRGMLQRIELKGVRLTTEDMRRFLRAHNTTLRDVTIDRVCNDEAMQVMVDELDAKSTRSRAQS